VSGPSPLRAVLVTLGGFVRSDGGYVKLPLWGDEGGPEAVIPLDRVPVDFLERFWREECTPGMVVLDTRGRWCKAWAALRGRL
jgi:hypothetical protein